MAACFAGRAVPYQRLGETATGKDDPGAAWRPVLIEFGPTAFPVRVQHRLFDLRRAGLVPILAHPERYEPVWRDDGCLDAILDAGAHLLLDVCSLVGKYGRAPQRAAEKLLEDDAYEAACSDAHRPRDVEMSCNRSSDWRRWWAPPKQTGCLRTDRERSSGDDDSREANGGEGP